MQPATGLNIGPGFQQWISDHQATPISDEMYFNVEMSVCMVKLADASGATGAVMLMYNKLTNEIFPFVQATL